MTTEDMIPTDITEAKRKLANLAAHMPDEPTHVHAFAAAIGARLPSEVYPSAVVLAASMVLADAQRNAPEAPPALRGLPAIVYPLLFDQLDEILDVMFPEAFATEAKAFAAKVRGR